MNTCESNHGAAAQSARVYAIHHGDEVAQSSYLFEDNLDHLQALEFEVRLHLALGILRRSGVDRPDQLDAYVSQLFMFMGQELSEISVQWLSETLSRHTEDNRRREEESRNAGISLYFPELCDRYGLDEFEQRVVLFLLMLTTSRDFREMYDRGRFEEDRRRSDGMQVRTLLAILCRDYREMHSARRHFSVDGCLIRNEIILFTGYMDSTTNILDESVCIHERTVRYLVGDTNLYDSSYSFIRRERSTIRIEHVILPDAIKQEVLSQVESFLMRKQSIVGSELDQYYEYGTGLTLLFHGPSGTGKTLFARALGNRLDSRIFSLSIGEVERKRGGGFEDLLQAVFREAELHGAIVFLDECDDLFAEDSQAGSALLIEIEKSRCITILATNKPVNLDPAMERRINLKVRFPFPDEKLRLQMWRQLLPKNVELNTDVDFDEFASRYHFTGGFIKNALLMAVNEAFGTEFDKKPLITREILTKAAELQAVRMTDDSRFCHMYEPQTAISELPLRGQQKEALRGAARAYRELREQGLGFSAIISSDDIHTGVDSVEAIAHENGMKVREFDFGQVMSLDKDSGLMDVLTQEKVSPLAYAFAPQPGDTSLVLFVDYEGSFTRRISDDSGKGQDVELSVFMRMLRSNCGLFCLVTKGFSPPILPHEFNFLLKISHPPEEMQLHHWRKHLEKRVVSDDQLAFLVESWPMHLREIDFIARQATIQSIIEGKKSPLDMRDILHVIERYLGKNKSPVLFGRNIAGLD